MTDKDKVKILSLIDGQQFIAKIEKLLPKATESSATPQTYKVEKPVMLVMVAQGQIGMRPAIIGMDFDEPIYVKETMLGIKPIKPEDELIDGYLQQFHDHDKPAIQLATNADAQALKNAEKRIAQ